MFCFLFFIFLLKADAVLDLPLVCKGGKKHKIVSEGWRQQVAEGGCHEVGGMPSVTSQRASVLHKDRRGSYGQRQVLVHGLQSRTTAAQVRHTILDHLTSQNTFFLQRSTVGEEKCGRHNSENHFQPWRGAKNRKSPFLKKN